MAASMSGAAFLRTLQGLPRAELELVGAQELLDTYGRGICDDCGDHHATVWAALACDGFTDARRRAAARRRYRRRLANPAQVGRPSAADQLARLLEPEAAS